jgi:hypothetical protein
VTGKSLQLTRGQILAFRRRAQALDERLPFGTDSIRRAAWAGLQDSMPRAAVLSIHARVAHVTPDILDHESLTQVWGPRYSAYVVAEVDAPLFTVARYPDDARGRKVAEDMAGIVARALAGRTMTDREIARQTGVGNGMRYGTTTGTIRIRWQGALAPKVWTVDRPSITPPAARIELARRFLHVFGPSTGPAFAKWAGIGLAQARTAFDDIARELLPVETPIGGAWLLAADESIARAKPSTPAAARFLPSGDTFYLFWGADRELLVPDEERRNELWTSRVWPGALLVDGELAGVWRRAGPDVTVDTWRRITPAEREAVEAEAATMPLPGLTKPIQVRWPD